MAIIRDIIEGGLRFSRDGYVAERVFIVTDITGNAESRYFEVLNTVFTDSSNAVVYGSQHPGASEITPEPLVIATDFDVEPMISEDNQTFKVTISYRTPTLETQPADDTQDVIVQVGSQISDVETNKDKDGSLITVGITTASGAVLPDQTGTVNIQVPQTVLQLQRKEQNSPLSVVQSHSGKVNDSTWNGWPARTMLIFIEGQSDDGGLTYDVTYTLQHNPNTWDAEIVFTDNATGEPHQDINLSTNNGVSVKRVYQEADFTTLNIAY